MLSLWYFRLFFFVAVARSARLLNLRSMYWPPHTAPNLEHVERRTISLYHSTLVTAAVNEAQAMFMLRTAGKDYDTHSGRCNAHLI